MVGQRCTICGTTAFPPTAIWCPNPECDGGSGGGEAFEPVELSRTGTVWSYTDARYEPPSPYIVPGDQFEPFALAAVELAAEGLVVLGPMVPGVGVDDLSVGTEVELVVELLYSDDEHTYLVWKWKPTEGVTDQDRSAEGGAQFPVRPPPITPPR